MNNKILKTCSVALMVMSAGAITGCSGIKSYKNEVTKEEFKNSFSKAAEKYSEEVNKILIETNKKSFEMDANTKEKTNITTTNDGTKTKNYEYRKESIEVKADFDNLAIKVEDEETKEEENSKEDSEGTFKSDETLYFNKNDIVYYALDNIDKTYKATSYSSISSLEERFMARSNSYYSENTAVSFYNQILDDFNYSISSGETTKYYIDGDRYTIVRNVDYDKEKDDSYTGYSKATIQLTFNKTNITYCGESDSDYTFTYNDDSYTNKGKVSQSYEFEASTSKIVMNKELSSDGEKAVIYKDEQTAQKGTNSETSEITVKFKSVSINTSLDGYRKG